MKRLLVSLLLFVHAVFSTEVRYINPPKFDVEHIGKKIICYRPMRNPGPQFFLERHNEKIVIHNYGHGGSGWSLAPGSVEYCLGLFLKERPSIDRNLPIAVVGGGCIGLFTAYNLLEMGFTHITLYAASFENLTSHNAGGLLSMRAWEEKAELNEFFLDLGCASYIFYKKIAEGIHKDFKAGAKILPTYFLNLEQSELEMFVNRVMAPAKDVLVDFGTGVARNMIAYDDSIFIDTGLMMDQLTDLLHNKVFFERRIVYSFADLEESVIFNCTGMGSKQLSQDHFLRGVQGHLIMLKNQEANDLNYMMIVDWDQDFTSSNQPIARFLDIFPKRLPGSPTNDVGVLGGTFIDGADESTPNEEEFDFILQRVHDFFYKQTL